MNSQTPHHPLAARQLSYIRTWAEWKKLWFEATHVETLHGLLHIGFQVELSDWDGEGTERLMLYLETADGYCRSDTFQSLRSGVHNDGAHIHTPLAKGWPENALRAVAYKAFVQLCTYVFKQDPKRSEYAVPGVSYEPDWWPTLSRRGRNNMEKMLWFLRLDDNRYGDHQLHNNGGLSDYLASKNHRDTFNAFALEMAQFILRRRYHDYPCDWHGVLDEFKPAAVNILHGLDRLGLLIQDDYYETLDERCRTRIHELALEAWIHADEYRPVKTMQEAVLAGSQAARIFTLLGVLDQERGRLDDIEKAKRQREEADRVLQQLQK